VISLRHALLICLVLLLFMAPVLAVEPVVSIEQAGSYREPFDVRGSIIYQITVTNDMSSTRSYSVELTLGPDINDMSISDRYVRKNFFVDPHESKSLKFNVSFLSPLMKKGDFGKWSSDKNDTSIWDKAWYDAQVRYSLGSEEEHQNPVMGPKLFKAFFDFKKASVTPSQGSNKDLYSYELAVLGSYRDNITLQVGLSPDGPWRDVGVQEYSAPGSPQTLRWSGVALDFEDFNIAYYRFTGRVQSKVYEGPFWPVVVQYRNNSVSQTGGLPNTPFTYGLELNASKRIDVGLMVADKNGIKYLAGKKSYENLSGWERLEWQGVSLEEITAGSIPVGQTTYSFSFYYPGSDTPFSSTDDRPKKPFPGPKILLVSFENVRVTPGSGSTFTPYTYCVDISTAQPTCDVELQTSDPGSSIWISQGTNTYDGSNKTLCWMNRRIDGDHNGLARYRFISGGSSSNDFMGPKVGVMNITAGVIPRNGSLYFTAPLEGTISSVYTYTYSAAMDSSEIKAPMEIDLEVYDPAAQNWMDAGSATCDSSKPRINISVNFAKLHFSEPFLGESRYRFTYKDRVVGEFPGPLIDTNLRNESAVEAGAQITYGVEVRSLLNRTSVALAYTTDNIKWQRSDAKPYESSSREWKSLMWYRYPRYYAYEFEVLRGRS